MQTACFSPVRTSMMKTIEAPRLKVLALPLYGPLAASTRYRLAQFVPGLSKNGIDVDVVGLLGDGYLRKRFELGKVDLLEVAKGVFSRISQLASQQKYDVAWVQCELIPFAPAFIEASLLRIPYAYDFDDAFHVKYRTGRFRRFAPLLGRKFDHVVRRASGVIPGNNYLYEYARQLNPNCTIFPTVIEIG